MEEKLHETALFYDLTLRLFGPTTESHEFDVSRRRKSLGRRDPGENPEAVLVVSDILPLSHRILRRDGKDFKKIK